MCPGALSPPSSLLTAKLFHHLCHPFDHQSGQLRINREGQGGLGGTLADRIISHSTAEVGETDLQMQR